MKTSRPGATNRGQGTLNSELDAAFATVQSAIEQHARGQKNADRIARECVTKMAGMVNTALADENRSESEKRLLDAKLRALIGAAARIAAS